MAELNSRYGGSYSWDEGSCHVDPRVPPRIRGRTSCRCTIWCVMGGVCRESGEQLVPIHACFRSGSLLGSILELDSQMGKRDGERSSASVPSRKRISTRGIARTLSGTNPVDKPINTRACVHGDLSHNPRLRILGHSDAQRKRDSCRFPILPYSSPLDHHWLHIPWSRSRKVPVGWLPSCDRGIPRMQTLSGRNPLET